MRLTIYLYTLIHNFGFEFRKFSFKWGLEWAKNRVLNRPDRLLYYVECTEKTPRWSTGFAEIAETGLYRAPYRFLEGLFLLPQVIAIPAYPIFSKLYHENKSFSQTATDLLRGLMLISFPHRYRRHNSGRRYHYLFNARFRSRRRDGF